MKLRTTAFAACLMASMPFLSGCAISGQGPAAQQDVVDRSTLALQEILNSTQSASTVDTLRSARAVMICPQTFKAGFIFGGSGGNCVLMARAAGGSWSDPAFYTIGSGSFGAQIGIQDAEVLIMIMNDRALGAVMRNRFKMGGDASLAFATVGAGVGGGTTTHLRADIVTFARTRGLFAGVSIEGSILSPDTSSNQAYYGQPYAPPQIVVQMMANNPGANPLRATLSQYGG
ncbi:lipid-binding SYLF domain-containing protein [Acidisoma silvae]|uniref:Lipid-binding SYLF domain-containing protein n=1 Tax=Acidisoma silvae TaxID=2802396 RepID=A0A963YQC1_9PROT|nr:lipid-binding SYLF domain-containing protein [Acidisoma silvae]MCB8874385.1 lipid-binding SYLF domain-containing protein [Acidisoma silvae]